MPKNNYIIPFGRRYTRLSGSGHYVQTIMCVDNLGIVVEHPKDIKPTDDMVRQHLIGYEPYKSILVEANSLQEALEEFYNYPECKTGIKHKAWEIEDSESRPVIEYAGCKYINHRGWTECTYYLEPDEKPSDGGGMMCVLDGLDEPPKCCPINNQKEHIGYRSEVVQIGGVWVKIFSKNVVEMDAQINGINPRKVNI